MFEPYCTLMSNIQIPKAHSSLYQQFIYHNFPKIKLKLSYCTTLNNSFDLFLVIVTLLYAIPFLEKIAHFPHITK